MKLMGTHCRFRELLSVRRRRSYADPVKRVACEVLEDRRLLAAVATGQFDVDAGPQRFIFDVAGVPASSVTLADAEVYDLTRNTERADNSLSFTYDPATTIAELTFSIHRRGRPCHPMPTTRHCSTSRTSSTAAATPSAHPTRSSKHSSFKVTLTAIEMLTCSTPWSYSETSD